MTEDEGLFGPDFRINDPYLDGILDKAYHVVDSQFLHNVGTVLFHRLGTHAQDICDLLRRVSLDHETEHLLLPFGKEVITANRRLLFAALQEREVDYERVNPRDVSLNLNGSGLKRYDAVLVRCLSHSRAYYLTRWLDNLDVPAVSSYRAIATCGDKLLMSAALQEAGVSTPRTVIAFTPEAWCASEENFPLTVVSTTPQRGKLQKRNNKIK